MKETRRSLCDSKSGVKKMAVGHHLGEHSHTIERSHNFLSGERVERQDLVNLEKGGSEWVWDQGGDLGVGLERRVGPVPLVWYCTARVQVGCCDIFHQSVVSLTRLPRVCRCQ